MADDSQEPLVCSRARALEVGLTMDLVGEDDLPAVNVMYRKLLTFLAQYNPTVDVGGSVDDDWVKKPGVLFGYQFRLRGCEDPVGFILFGNHKLSAAMGSAADFLVWEFFVDESQRRKGIGAMVMNELLARHPGRWSLDVLPDNDTAVGFWGAVLAPYQLVVEDWSGDDGIRFLRHFVSSEGDGAKR